MMARIFRIILQVSRRRGKTLRTASGRAGAAVGASRASRTPELYLFTAPAQRSSAVAGEGHAGRPVRGGLESVFARAGGFSGVDV